MIVRILLAVLIVCGLVAGYIYFTGGTGLPPVVTKQLSFIPTRQASSAATLSTDALASVQIPSLPQNASEQLKTVGERTGELSSTVGKVLGEAVQVGTASGEQSLQERAFDYGRYLYCQQVVKDYEARSSVSGKNN